MQGQVAKRYAKALFSLTSETGKPEDELKTLLKISHLMKDEGARLLFVNPTVPFEKRKQFLDYFLEKIGASPVLRNFTGLLNSSRRFIYIDEITKCYRDMLQERSGSVMIDLYSAIELSPADLEKIRKKLEVLLQKTLTLTPHIDRTILGGFVAKYGNNIIDMSVSSQISSLRKSVVN